MSGIATQSGCPSVITQGDTVIFTERFADFPNDTWTAKLWLNLGTGTAPVSVTATNSSADFLFTVPATTTTNLSAKAYEFGIVVTDGTQVSTPKQGTISVLPNLAVAATPSFAQSQVTLLETVLAEFNATTRQTVSFNGQSFSRASIKEYRDQLVYFQAVVIAEKEKEDALRGKSTNRLIGTRFNPQYIGPYGYNFGWPYPATR